MDVPTSIPHCYPTMAEAQASFHLNDPVITNQNRDNWYQSYQFSARDSQITVTNLEQSGLRNPYTGAIEAIEEDGVTQSYRSSNFPTFFHPSTPICNSYLAQPPPSPELPPVAYANTAAPYCNTYISPYTSIDPPYCNIAPQYITKPLHYAISQPYSITPATSITKNDETPVNIPYFSLASDNSQYNTSNPHSPVTNCIFVHEENNFQHQPPNSQLFLPNYNPTPLPIQYPNDQQQIHNPTITQPSYPNCQPQLCTPSLSFFDSSFSSMVTVDVDTNSTSVTDVDGIIVARTRALETEVLAEIVRGHEEGLDSIREVKWEKSNATAENEEDEAEHQVFAGRPETKSSAAAKLLHGNETQTVTEETNEDHGSLDYFNDTSEEYHSNQKLCLQHEQIEASKSTLADRGAEILEGIICIREDSVYNDSVDVGYQESTEEAIVVEETSKIDFEGNLCMDGAHHDLDGQLSLAEEKGMEITCSNSGDVKEIRTHETSIGETSSPIIFEETNIDRAGIMCSASAGLSVTVSDYSLHCQKQLKGSDESMTMSLDETSRKVGEEEEPQEVIEAKENDDACLFKVNIMQNTEEEVYSPGSEESEQENQLKILFVTPDTKSASLSEQQTLSQSAEISAVSMSSGNNLKKSILGRFSHGRSLEVVELKEKEVNKRSALKSKGEEITGKGSNNIDEKIASPDPLGFIKVMFEDGNEPVEGNVKTPFGNLLEESGGCIEISAKAVVAAYSKYINSIAITPNDSLVCSGYQDCIACILRLPDLVCVIVISGHKRGIWSIEFSPVNQCAITTSGNKTIKIWAISDGSCLKTFEGHTSSVLRASILTHGTRFVSCWADGLLKLWTVKTNKYVVTYDQQKDKVWALVLGKKTGMLATGGSKAVVNLWHDSTASDKYEEFRKKENGEDGRSSAEQLLPLLGHL